MRVEFCEADVLDVFDEWRRAVGVSAIPVPRTPGTPREHAARQAIVAAHLERVVARLTALRAGDDRSLDAAIDALVRELDAARAGAKALRGDARQRFLARLQALDASLLDAARARLRCGDVRSSSAPKRTPSSRPSAIGCRATPTISRAARVSIG